MAFKKILQKVWVWFKHYWYAPALVVYTLFLWVVLRRKNEAEAILEVRSRSYQDQIDAINATNKDEIQKRDEILEKYNETIKKLEEEFAKYNKELDDKKRESVKEIVEKYHENPDTLAIMISKRFGFKYTED